MRLVVSDYEKDEMGSLDCQFCNESDQAANFTVLTFYDEHTNAVCVVCPEHLDEMVSAALRRHKAGMEKNDPFWYMTADEDPWDE